MSERYTRLFSLPENLYAVGAPAVIAAGALLKDNQTGKVLAQLKIQNIGEKLIKAVTVRIAPLDTRGQPLGETVSYQYLDLNAARDADFGQKSPIALPDAATRAFSASVSVIIFADNTVWTASETVWEPLSAPVPLEQAFDDKELVTQYRIKYGENCKCIFKREKDLWRCACGALNHENERLCHKCQKEATILAALDLDELKASKNKRLEIAKQKAAEEKAAAEAKSKRTKKLAMIVVPIAVVAIVAGVLVSGSMQRSADYNNAVALLEVGDYEAAINAFDALDGYKDSAEQLTQAQENLNFAKAVDLINQGADNDAYLILEQINNLPDAQEYLAHFSLLLTQEQLGDNVTSYQYDDAGRLTHEVFRSTGIENESVYTYDDAGNLTHLSTGSTDYVYTYDELGNCIEEKRENSDGSIGTKQYSYDEQWNIVQIIETETGSHGSSTYTYSYSYDSNGNCIREVSNSAIGQTIRTRAFDDHGNCTEDTFTVSDGSVSTNRYSYTYDDNGNCIEKVSSNENATIIETYHYDENGNCVKKESNSTNGSSQTISYSYDEYGNCVREMTSDSSGSKSTTTYTFSWFYTPNAIK